MATLIDNAGTQHYANKMVLAENRKVGSKSLPSALADVDNLIEEMRGQFEAEYGSALDMKLENSSGVFSVGTGSGIDKRDEVENSFTDVEIKGRTLQNLSSLPPTEYSTDTGGYRTLTSLSKPNTKYTLIFEVKDDVEFTPSSHMAYLRVEEYNGGKTLVGLRGKISTSYTTHRLTFTTSAIEPNNRLSLNHRMAEGTRQYVKNIILLEGDHTNTPLSELPYVEGIQGVGEEVENGYEVEVKSCGKNIIPINTATATKWSDDVKNHILLEKEEGWLKPNTTYTLSMKPFNITDTGDLGVRLKIFNNSKTLAEIWGVSNKKTHTFTTPSSMIGSLLVVGYTFDTTRDFTDIQLEEGSTPTPYEPYQEDTLTYTLDEQLHRLPNGVCDEISNGKLIRRVGKVVLDGNKQYSLNTTLCEGASSFYASCGENNILVDSTQGKFDIICDTFPVAQAGNMNQTNKNAVCFNQSITNLLIDIETSKLEPWSSENPIKAFREWATLNPTTVLYQLETPIITDLETPSLQCWKNGTISIDSTVPPTTTHTVALNKPAQIKRNIEELTTLRHKVKTLEEQYDQIALEQAHKLELLNHSFELDYNI